MINLEEKSLQNEEEFKEITSSIKFLNIKIRYYFEVL